jgi:hypothetical protein
MGAGPTVALAAGLGIIYGGMVIVVIYGVIYAARHGDKH